MKKKLLVSNFVASAAAALFWLLSPTIANAQGAPVAWWTFDEAAGTTAADSVANGHDGTLIGGAVFDPAGGKFGGAVMLDGIGGLVEVPDADDLEFPQGQDFSITLFYNSGGVAADNNNGLITKGYGDSPRSADGYYLLQVTNPDGFEFDSRCCAGETPRTRTGVIGSGLTDGAWHNVTVVRDYTAGEIRSYIDGNLASTITMGVDTNGDWNMGVNGESLQIGDHFNRFTTGKFDDVALWRRALSDEEIALIVENGIASTIGEVAIFFTPDPVSVLGGDSSTLSWRVAPGATVTIDQGIGDVTAMTDANGDGSIEVTPLATTTYTLTADNGITSEDLEAVVNVRLIDSFEASAGAVLAGEPVTLSWVAAPAASLAIDNGIGNVDGQTVDGVGSIQIVPTMGATYTLTASAAGAELTAMVTVNVLVETDGPVAYWPFDETDGTIAADLSGSANEHPAELFGGAIFVPAGGKFGGAACLDGTDGEIRAPDHEDYEFAQGQDFSITLFYNSGGVASDTNNGLITKGYADNPRSPDGYYLLQVVPSGLAEFDSRCCADATPRTRSGQVGSSITDGEWHNLTFVRDHGAGNYRIYLDGVVVSTTVLDAAGGGDWNMGVNTEDLVIGDHLNRFTTGKFDEVAIWRRVLSEGEIATIAAEGVSVSAPGSFIITAIDYSPGTDEVTLTWAANANATYGVFYSKDLAVWEGDLGDSLTMAVDDEVPDDGDFLTKTFDLSEFTLGGDSRLFFRVEVQ